MNNDFIVKKEIVDHLRHLIRTGNEPLSIQKEMGFSDDTMARFYQAARAAFVAKHYADAADAFVFLIGMNPSNADYWIGYGMASQMNRDFDSAVDSYESAALCELDNPIPYMYLGKCLFAMHERDNALAAFQLAVEYAGTRPEFRALKKAASKARDLLLNQV